MPFIWMYASRRPFDTGTHRATDESLRANQCRFLGTHDRGERPMSAVDVYHRILDAVEFYDYLGLTLVESDDGVCRMQIPADATLRTPTGHVHGGVIASLVDMAGLYAVWLRYEIPGGTAYTTEMTVSFENSTAQGITAHARIHGRDAADDRDEVTVEVNLFELPDTHEFGTAYVPENDPERTRVATSEIEFVVLADVESAPGA
jgi:uncharacterized protein (TIGR00369 family)